MKNAFIENRLIEFRATPEMKHELEITGAENPLNCQVQFQSPKSNISSS